MPPSPPYAPALGCDEVLTRYCNTHCPHAKEHGSLLARIDQKHGEHLNTLTRHSAAFKLDQAWRCYARGTLDENELAYVGGKAYCTRHYELQQELNECVRKRSLHKPQARATTPDADDVSGATARAAVDSMGGSRRMAPSPMPPQIPPQGSEGRGGGGGRAGDVSSGSSGYGSSMHARQQPWSVQEASALIAATQAAGGRRRVGIVVAHCLEPLHWLEEVRRRLHLIASDYF